MKSSRSRTRTRDISVRPNSPYHAWTPLDNSNSSNKCSISKITISRGAGESTEVDAIGLAGIKVERDFKQEIHHE